MKNNHFYFIIVLTLSLLLLAGCVVTVVDENTDGKLTSAEPIATVSTGSVAEVSLGDTGTKASVGANAPDYTQSPAVSTTSSMERPSSVSDTIQSDIVFEDGYEVYRSGYREPLTFYEGDMIVFTELEFKNLYPDTYALPNSPDTSWITFATGPTILKIGEQNLIPIQFLQSTEIREKHIYVADWKISDTSVLKMIDWDPLKGYNVEALKPGKVKVTMTVKMDTGSYKKSTTVYVIAEDEPLPVIKTKIEPYVPPTEDERLTMQPSSEPTTTQE